MQIEQKVTPFLTFENQAEEAARLYVSVVPDSELGQVTKNPMTGAAMTVEFTLAGLKFVALNMGQPCEPSMAFSIAVACDSQEEIDHLWAKLTDGGEELQCGWLKDRFGVHWQIVPRVMTKYLQESDAETAGRVMGAMMQMVKLDIAALQRAYEGR
ncbi:3-demethylubiquinone-9 3-methyltransferase [Maioricimonas rarisocia]|uniref:3-demethylubiquinone-9 3-methyltransferase n=1 Tax=Maioricimonas rarisocia TaxID=2528026 RepID=A0A517ZF67_9PLAN|nr:VOC family protein [Maioricimonas rarisocia]QDU41143.1 3-demethylubiquinone-9 3-methyltransferase [Maioricimonas rarisocia]